MKNFLLLALAALLILGGYAYFVQTAEAPTADVATETGTANVEEYVRQNISALSPEPAVMGGTFYVTDIKIKNGEGTVWYEDGHIALVADFTYAVDKYGVSIASFVVQQ